MMPIEWSCTDRSANAASAPMNCACSPGTDPMTGRRCYRTKTVRGNRTEAERELAAMIEVVGRGAGIAARATVSDLLEQWFAIASIGWSPTTVRQTRSVLNGQLHPHVGHILVADLTT